MRRLKLTLATFATTLLTLATLLAPSAVADEGQDEWQDEQAAVAATPFKGAAFDICNTPSLATMKAWRSSPYRAVGIYYAGRGRHCPVQRNLNKSWVTQVHRMGWRVLPVFVG